ncbi:hypothetical protein EH196_00360 [Bacillus sp. C1-1]|nr:hypothetical protein EH196_00360 [Bacillus sp. C1-1]
MKQLVTVKDYGAIGNQTNDTTAFQKMFAEEREIYVPRGIYHIDETIRVYENTSVVMENGAVIRWRGRANRCVFLNGEYGNTEISGYSGDGNIYFQGGTIDLGEIPSGATGYGPIACGWAHAESIHMENVTFTGGYNNHFVDMTAVRRSSYINCVFKDMTITGGNVYEALQIDMSTNSAFPHFGATDNKPSYDCVVDRCTFRNVAIGVGSHASRVVDGKQIMYNAIRITNCAFYNMNDHGIRLDSYEGAYIEGNYIDGTGQHGIYGIGGKGNFIGANYINNIKEHGICLVDKGIGGTSYPAATSIVHGSRIFNCGRSAVRIVRGKGIDVTQVKAIDSGEDGLSATDSDMIRFMNCDVKNASTTGNGRFNGVRLSGVSGGQLSGLDVSNKGHSTNYANGIQVTSTSHNINTFENRIDKGSSGRVNIAINNGNRVDGETYLTELLNVSGVGQTIRLNDDINNYTSIIVGSGIVSRKETTHSIARGFYHNGFRRGDDVINVATANGRIIMDVVSPTELRIVRADNPVRVIIGKR